jgi:hypothetical protein
VRVAVPKIIALRVEIGTRFPAVVTSQDKVLLAALTPDALELALKQPSQSEVVIARRDRTDLDDELAQVRDRGWALAEEELSPGCGPSRRPCATAPARCGPDAGVLDVDLVDLRELQLPLHDEPHHPKLQNYIGEPAKRWSARVGSADAVIFVMPEYNHSFSAPLQNAIDYLHAE